jgi:hypothetical protein
MESKMVVLRRFLRNLTVWTFLAIGLVPRAGAAGWSDNFNDGNAEDGSPVTWTYNEIGFTPGNYDASNGDYTLSAPGNTNNDSLLASVGVNFTETYVRTQASVLPGTLPEEVDGTLGVLARYDPSTISGYAAILSTGAHLQLLRVDQGAPTDLAEVRGLDIDTLTDAMIQLDAVGDLLSVYLWRPGDPKPEEPVATFNDNTYASGRAGILHNENDDNTLGVFRFAAAQDTPFVEGLAGDYNGNGTVDAADYVVWRDGPAAPDGYTLWRANFGAGGGVAGAASAVPEPATSAAALTALAMMAWGKRGARSRRRVGTAHQ